MGTNKAMTSQGVESGTFENASEASGCETTASASRCARLTLRHTLIVAERNGSTPRDQLASMVRTFGPLPRTLGRSPDLFADSGVHLPPGLP